MKNFIYMLLVFTYFLSVFLLNTDFRVQGIKRRRRKNGWFMIVAAVICINQHPHRVFHLFRSFRCLILGLISWIRWGLLFTFYNNLGNGRIHFFECDCQWACWRFWFSYDSICEHIIIQMPYDIKQTILMSNCDTVEVLYRSFFQGIQILLILRPSMKIKNHKSCIVQIMGMTLFWKI